MKNKQREHRVVAINDVQAKARARLFADIFNQCTALFAFGEQCGRGFIEAIALEESWLSDRLESWLMATKNQEFQKRSDKNGNSVFLSLGQKIEFISRDEIFIKQMNDYLNGNTKGKVNRLTKEEYDFIGHGDAVKLLNNWRKLRNSSIHQLAVLTASDVESGRGFTEKYNDVVMTAKIGMKLLRIVNGICTNARRRKQAKNKKYLKGECK